MILRCYSIYDRKAFQYHPPFFSTSDGAAVRTLSDLVADNSTSIARHPGDYVLFFVGEYDDQKGAMLPQTPLAHVMDASALVPVQPPLPFDKDPK